LDLQLSLWLIAWCLLNLFAGQTSTEHHLDVETHVLTLSILHVVIFSLLFISLPFVLIPMMESMLVTRMNVKLAKPKMSSLSEMKHALAVLSNVVRKKHAKMANVFHKLQFSQSTSAPLSNVVLELFVETVNAFQ
jgi:hypothetical protein